jgi:cytochrome oxidase Cu insertion factor (SCO1/SenC/PrrC family)
MLDSRRRLPLLVIALLLSACVTGPSLKVGDPAMPFTALDSNGKPISLEAFKGQKHVVLVFYIGHT